MVLGSASPLIGLLVFQIGINGFYIPMEERNMESAFGQQYLDYKKKVRRWI
jgi:protein-S-isoprenylcysteine O-methyltransferase Ste14